MLEGNGENLLQRVKATPAEGAKSNPSKRHRDRLNSELDRLAGLLPFPKDILSSLDKLSILRLSVSFLRTKSFFSVAFKDQPSNGIKRSGNHDNSFITSDASDRRIPEGELLLQALNGFVLVVTAEGNIFFCSNTIQDFLGFHQTDVMHQSVFELIHTEDQQEFKRNLHWALNPPVSPEPQTDTTGLFPEDSTGGDSTTSCLVSYNPDQLPPENSSFLERGFVCRFRCLLDNSSGFLPLSIQGRLKFLHGQSRQQPQLALFAIATPLQPPAILEIRTKNMIFRTKHKLDFTPMACDAKGKIVLGYTEAELRVRGSGYQFIHAADMLHCAENHIRMIKTGESGLTVFRLLTKENRWKWVQANARLIYKNGKPDYIIATQRPLAEEEGREHLRKRSMHLPFTFATGEALLYQTGYPLHGFPDSFQDKAKGSKTKKGKIDKGSADELKPNSLLGALMRQDKSVYVSQPDMEPRISIFSNFCSRTDNPGGLLGNTSWNIVSNREGMRSNGETVSFDPLLSTLDSLSLDEGETCSNSELFSALEDLGLNADDLELLLLDERMIRVELDPTHIPSLNDLLTNNEILSYVHSSLQTEQQNVSPQPRPTAPAPTGTRQPVAQLSLQMQQHISMTELLTTQPGQVQPASYSSSVRRVNPDSPPPRNTQLNGGHLEPQWQLLTDSTALLGFQNQLLSDRSYLPNQHITFPANPEVPAYSDTSDSSLLNGPDLCHHQSVVLPSYLTRGPSQSSAPELEQLLALPLPHLDGLTPLNYSIFSPTVESKVDNLRSATNAAYVRTNGVVPVSCPDGPSTMQEPQKSGFFI